MFQVQIDFVSTQFVRMEPERSGICHIVARANYTAYIYIPFVKSTSQDHNIINIIIIMLMCLHDWLLTSSVAVASGSLCNHDINAICNITNAHSKLIKTTLIVV